MSAPSLDELRRLLTRTTGTAPTPMARRDPRAGMVTGAWGEEGVGKTHLGLTWPGPMVYHDLESNAEETFRAFDRSDVVAYHRYRVPIMGEREQNKTELDRFVRNYYGGLRAFHEAGVVGTHVVDGVTRLWELIRYAIVPLDADGRVKSAWAYGPANDLYAAVLTRPRDYGQHLYFTARACSVWETSTDTDGRARTAKTARKRADWKEEASGYYPSVIVEIANRSVLESGGKVATERVYHIHKCNLNGALKGRSYASLDFETLVALIELTGEEE